jgi:hypothetical protein
LCFKSLFIVDVASTKGKNLKSLLGTSLTLMDTYKMYPYRESHGTNALPVYYEGTHVIPMYNSTC